jgi:hypothetical protein
MLVTPGATATTIITAEIIVHNKACIQGQQDYNHYLHDRHKSSFRQYRGWPHPSPHDVEEFCLLAVTFFAFGTVCSSSEALNRIGS